MISQEMVDLGSGAKREVEDIALTRYACYLIPQQVKQLEGPATGPVE